MDEVLIEELRQAQVFSGELGAILVDSLDAREELVVEENAILMSGELWGDFFFDLLDGIGSLCACEGGEDQARSVEESARLLVGEDRVLEGWCFGIVRDAVDLDELLLHALLKGRQEVLWSDLVKGGRLVVKLAYLQQGIGALVLAVAGGECRHSEEAKGDKEAFHSDV